MGKKYQPQRQPLRKPQNWNGEAAVFVTQLEKLLDDLYLKVADLQAAENSMDERVTALEEE